MTCVCKRPRIADFGLRTTTPGDFSRSYYQGCRNSLQIMWIIYRLLTATWFFGFSIWVWIDFFNWNFEALSAMSNWTVHGYTIYACVAALNVLLDRLCICSKDAGAMYTADDLPAKFRHMFHWVLFYIFINAGIIVAITYWGVLTRPGEERDVDLWIYEVTAHTLPAVLGLLDVWFSAVPVRFLHVIYTIGYFMVYFFFAVIYWAAAGRILYPFLDFGEDPGLAIGFFFIFLVIVILVHALIWGMDCLKRFLSRRTARYFRSGEDGMADNLPMTPKA